MTRLADTSADSRQVLSSILVSLTVAAQSRPDVPRLLYMRGSFQAAGRRSALLEDEFISRVCKTAANCVGSCRCR